MYLTIETHGLAAITHQLHQRPGLEVLAGGKEEIMSRIHWWNREF